ncbi:hypothetical protein PINS_up015694 [Pythium insidiosum]|nr:hypothetical protein PINS_up015694 [Pythium insidiosum]
MCGPRPLQHHSFANLDDVVFTHLHWTIDIDFDARRLTGAAEYSLELKRADVQSVVLDTHHLTVSKAFVDGHETTFELLKEHEVFGRALVIPITADAKTVKVHYATTDKSSGLQWLAKELTAGKTHPYLFTQCQAIHARSIVPCPDTPGCKFTYSATATVPEWCTCLMSAIASDVADDEEAAPEGKQKVAFRQEVPIPSYLLAIAAGKMESKELGPRSRVWAEPSVVEKAAHEFSQTEEFLKYAEEITGQEYVWKRYDLVCLPPSFPYGGMENPCLTFVTPTLLAGDRSLADVVAHEISHSWTGNLVTNQTWKDFWLNEGWTVWLERKIMTKIYKDEHAYDLKATMGLRALRESVQAFWREASVHASGAGERWCRSRRRLLVDPVREGLQLSQLPHGGRRRSRRLRDVRQGVHQAIPLQDAHVQRLPSVFHQLLHGGRRQARRHQEGGVGEVVLHAGHAAGHDRV